MNKQTLYNYLTKIYIKAEPSMAFDKRKAQIKLLNNQILNYYYKNNALTDPEEFLDQLFNNLELTQPVLEVIITSYEYNSQTLYDLITKAYQERQKYYDKVHATK